MPSRSHFPYPPAWDSIDSGYERCREASWQGRYAVLSSGVSEAGQLQGAFVSDEEVSSQNILYKNQGVVYDTSIEQVITAGVLESRRR